MSVPSLEELIRSTPVLSDPVDIGDGRAEITVPDDMDKPMEPDNYQTISDRDFVRSAGRSLRDAHLRIVRLHLRDALAHLALARWHDTVQERQRAKLAKEFPDQVAALDEVIRLRAELAKSTPQGNITRIDFGGGA